MAELNLEKPQNAYEQYLKAIAEKLAGNEVGDIQTPPSNAYEQYLKAISERIPNPGHTPIMTTAPTSDNTDGLVIVVLESEPDTYYNGYYYIITGEEV